MKMNTRYAAVVGAAIGTALLVSYAVADPGRGHAYGHSQSSVSRNATSGVVTSGPQLAPGDGLAAPTFKNGSDFFTTATTEKSHGRNGDFIGVPANAQTGAQKSDPASQFLTPTSAGSNTSAVASSATTATSKPSSVTDTAAQQPEWLINATSSRHEPKPSATAGGTQPSPSPTQSATPAAIQSPAPTLTTTPYPTDVPDVFPAGTPEGHIMPPGLSGGD
jgi:hypothetical protein